MITPNTKITALEVLQECGIENAEEKFGKVRVRIGGIPAINQADRVITIQPSAKTLEVVVGVDLYELILSEGNEENNAETHVVSEGAQVALEAKGKESNEKAERLQGVKALAQKIKESSEYKPSKEEQKYHEEALEKVEADRVAVEAAKNAPKAKREVTRVESK